MQSQDSVWQYCSSTYIARCILYPYVSSIQNSGIPLLKPWLQAEVLKKLAGAGFIELYIIFLMVLLMS